MNLSIRRRSLWMMLLLGQALLLFAGCGQRKHLTAGGMYRIEKVQNDAFVLPPPVPLQYKQHDPLTIQLAMPASTERKEANCTMTGDFFRLTFQPKKSYAILRLPSLEDWKGIQREEDLQRARLAFLADVTKLQQSGCLSADQGMLISKLLPEVLPTRPNESLYYRNGYRPGSGLVDLKPGIRLQIQRAYFRDAPAPEGKHNLGNYLGITTISYQVTEDAQRRVRFYRTSVESSKKDLARQFQKDIPDFSLAAQTGKLPFYRLFLFTSFVPQKTQRSALIIGTKTMSALEEITNTIRANPKLGCREISAHHEADCISFDGPVSVSAEIQVVLNGKPTYVAVGSSIRGLFGKEPVEKIAENLRTLHIQRLFENSYADLRFRPEDDILSLILVGGDRVSWTGF